MSNLHVLTKDGDEVRVLAHVAIPATNNVIGVPWRTAVLRSKLSTGLSALPSGDGTQGTIDATEVSAHMEYALRGLAARAR